MIIPHHGKWPQIHETAFVAPSADVIGEVEIGSHSSVWFQCVLRGDVNAIRIGSRTNIQDATVVHVTRRKTTTVIGDEVTVGHRVTLHGCRIGNRVLVGMGAILMDDVEVGDDCLIGAGALLTPGTKVPAGSLVVGSPAKVKRPVTAEEREFFKRSAENYVGDARDYYAYVHGPLRHDQERADADLESFNEEEGAGGLGTDPPYMEGE